jgi:aminocarboxymuconate-semialdehyde decarboxylase
MVPARVIDTHSHYLPAEVVRDARKGTAIDGVKSETKGGVEWLIHRQGFSYPVPTSFHDLEERLLFMDGQGTDQAILSISPTLYCYWVDASEAIDFCAMANDSMARSASESGGRLVAAATLPMQDPDAAVKELRRAVDELGMCAVEFAPSIQGVLVDDPALRPVLAAVNELRIPILLHSSPFEPRPENLREFYLNNLIGNPLATTVGAARLIFSGILDDLPELSVVLVHGGGYLPYQIGRLDHGHKVRPEAKACAQAPSTYLPRFLYDTITHAPDPLRFLVDFVGADHVVYGTDFAYDMGGGSFASQVEGADLDADQLERVGWRTAADLFGIAPVSG